MNRRGGVEVCWEGGRCVGKVGGVRGACAGRVRGCAGRAWGVRGGQ